MNKFDEESQEVPPLAVSTTSFNNFDTIIFIIFNCDLLSYGVLTLLQITNHPYGSLHHVMCNCVLH